jgi:hypothetical protein
MKKIIYISLIGLFLSSCGKDDPTYLFEVDEVSVQQSSADKNRLKSDIEFVSIAYADLFGSNISQGLLDDISITYKSFGDKSLVIEMIVRRFIADEDSQLPIIDRSNTEAFVMEAYEKLYNRTPNAFEKWYLTDYLNEHTDVTAEMVYYALMTANEYRYY